MTKLPLTAGAAAAALLAATTAFAEEEAVVNVYNWSDYIDEERAGRFRGQGNRHQGSSTTSTTPTRSCSPR